MEFNFYIVVFFALISESGTEPESHESQRENAESIDNSKVVGTYGSLLDRVKRFIKEGDIDEMKIKQELGMHACF